MGCRFFYTDSGKRLRGPLVRKIAERNDVAIKTIYSLLRKYWQRGCTPNALLPDYDKSGGPGKKRTAGATKLGRPRTTTPGDGVIIDVEIERMFRAVLDQHYLSEKKHSLAFAHRRFEDMYETSHRHIKKEDYPTLAQLRYFYEREYANEESIRKRAGKIKFRKDIRQLHSTVAANLHGPGAIYEIDATIADIYLVSSDRREIIGRPTIYVVVDAYSRLIVGFYIGLENPSYITAMLALELAIIDKEKLFKLLPIAYSSEDWPAIGLPDAILADKGELMSHQAEFLENAFNVRFDTTPSFRGDAKGVVERNFRTLQADFKKIAPGAVEKTKIKKEGGEDYRLESALTLSEFTTIIVSSIIYRNRYSVLENYDREYQMPTDMPSVPINIWNWGIQHKSGRLRAVNEDSVRIALLPRKVVTISDYGIRFFGAYYSSAELVKSGWLLRTERKLSSSFMAAYDPVSVDRIFFFPEPGKNNYWECFLTDRSREFRGITLWEMKARIREVRNTNAKAKVPARQKKRELEKLIQETIKGAVEQRPSNIDLSKRERISGIQNAREIELNRERTARKENSTKKATDDNQTEIIQFPRDESENVEDDDASYPDLSDILFEDDE
ncbi:Transposon Tn7 transposition protein tnsB [Salinispira pacifica]|uniref:Transposon Tn7 transposition protein tnsB n=1 Tax=Salinispira pacifica TaxID=1307761 RepID=V5WLQ6_9SPIO|nr:Transposon Tn7 transposition protein tnsB [Salinispira pacifica]